jgi:alanyl-tRNA synthetase
VLGPCGPNTELYFDRGPSFGPEGGPKVGGDRYLEYWNLVFMQYERAADGTLGSLPAQNIDTGAGLERIAALLQDTPSVFETDAFFPLIEWAQERSGRAYGADGRADRAFRVLADHGRAMTFLASDGIRPSNEGRGYVLRRIVRRAVSEGTQLGLSPEAVVEIAATVAERWGDAYPELVQQASAVADTLGAEADQFARTLQQGRKLLSEVIERSAGTGVSGEDAFRLHDTHGFPLDLTVDAAGDAGLTVDRDGFERLMADQRDRSRAGAATGADAGLVERRAAVAASAPPARAAHNDPELEIETTITAIEAIDGDELLVKLEATPFYAQGGGQVSDQGVLCRHDVVFEVREVSRVGDDQVLRVRAAGPLEVGQKVKACVAVATRKATQANHTATHVMNWALRERLGSDVRQAGSYVGPDKLRFDFTHRGRVPADELARIERMVNDRVAEDAPVTTTVMPRADADGLGAVGIFEEKYGEFVRVVAAGDYSKELCGGTHVARTGDIGRFAITTETSVGAGVRRIEALTGPALVDHLTARTSTLEGEIAVRDARIAALEAELKRAKQGAVDPNALAAAATAYGSVQAVVTRVDASDMDELLEISDRVKRILGDGAAVVLGAGVDGRAMLVASFGAEAVAVGLSAASVVKEISPLVDGGGGGKDTLARAGGKDPSRVDEALARASELLAAHAAAAAPPSTGR